MTKGKRGKIEKERREKVDEGVDEGVDEKRYNGNNEDSQRDESKQSGNGLCSSRDGKIKWWD